MLEHGTDGPLEWAVAAEAFQGSADCGDAHAVVPFDGGVLLAVVDGLGHGEEASEASEAAVRILRADPASPVGELLGRCHEALRRTRGAAMTLASFHEAGRRLEWAGIGNVEGIVVRPLGSPGLPRERAFLSPGVVGHRMPPPRVGTVPFHPGDMLAVATDGVADGFSDGVNPTRAPLDLAPALLSRHGSEVDDRLVFVARFEDRRVP